MDVPEGHLRQLLESTKRITREIMPKDTIEAIISESRELLACERVSVLVYDSRIDMLTVPASDNQKLVRVARGEGVVGHVFDTLETVNIPVYSAGPRFNPETDGDPEGVTKSLLVMPILDDENQLAGVLRAINK